MQPDSRDAAHLWRMLKPARYLVRAGATLTAEQLGEDEEKQYSVAKALELIGEAARKLSPEFQAAHPHIPWSKIKGMRHMMVHEYHRANWDQVWKTITVQVPEFLVQIEPLVPELPSEENEDASSQRS
jgi:uncharacterized protein with HEPN domain